MTEMPKAYDFRGTEERLYQWWEENGWFKPEARPADAEPFVISIPPPNVTGELHMGHAMFVALEDLMIRRARMQGRAALWVPGTDHAGIATQLQVERMLRDEGTSRAEVGRDEFLRRTWEWKARYGGQITHQLRRLGASCAGKPGPPHGDSLPERFHRAVHRSDRAADGPEGEAPFLHEQGEKPQV